MIMRHILGGLQTSSQCAIMTLDSTSIHTRYGAYYSAKNPGFI